METLLATVPAHLVPKDTSFTTEAVTKRVLFRVHLYAKTQTQEPIHAQTAGTGICHLTTAAKCARSATVGFATETQHPAPAATWDTSSKL